MNPINHIKNTLLAGQHGHPKGIVGYLLGEQMVHQHIAETEWTIALLKLQSEDHVLELGFGAGRAIELVTAHLPNGQVSGIDISRTMVSVASRRNARAIRVGRVRLRHGDLTNLPFPNNQFNKVFSIQTLYFWPDPSHALSDIFRVLKPRGILVITLFTGKIDTDEVTGLDQYEQLLEENIVPTMRQIGFTQAIIK